MYVIIVDFEIEDGTLGPFLALMTENAAASLRDEPGCRQFDVCQDPDNPGQIFLYELYDDRAAFEAHLGMPHFKSFDAATKDMIRSKTVRAYTRLAP
ncbi:MAG: putative quinol monooxygenase [Candidatus Puniceispirillaceae bacterium]